jgi:hypothetical protein
MKVTLSKKLKSGLKMPAMRIPYMYAMRHAEGKPPAGSAEAIKGYQVKANHNGPTPSHAEPPSPP